MKTPGARKPNVILFSVSPKVAEIAIVKSRNGNAIVISASRETTVSIEPRK